MPTLIAIDQGTTSTRTVAYNQDLNIVYSEQQEYSLQYPQDGWVEIDPLELINEYGADSLRFTLISMASPGRDVKLAKDRVIGNRNFITKIWSANNFLQLNKCKYDKKININSIKLPTDITLPFKYLLSSSKSSVIIRPATFFCSVLTLSTTT